MPTVTRKKAKKNMFMHAIKLLAPIRILKQARQLYMKGVDDCAAGLGYSGAASYPIVPMKMKFSVNTSKESLSLSCSDEDELQKDLLGMVPNRTVGKKMRVDVQGRGRAIMAYNGERRIYGVGVRKMERIDEDKACSFEEDQIDMKTSLLFLYPTIRNYAINRHLMQYYY